MALGRQTLTRLHWLNLSEVSVAAVSSDGVKTQFCRWLPGMLVVSEKNTGQVEAGGRQGHREVSDAG